MTAANLLIGVLALGLVIYRQLIPRRVRSNWRIALILGALGLTVQYFKGRHIDAVIIAEIGVSLILAAAFGLARASTVRLSYREGQWWSQGTWLTAVLWIVSVAAHLGFDYVVAGHNPQRLRQCHAPALSRGNLQHAAAARPGPCAAGRYPGSGRPGLVRLITPDGAQPGWLCTRAQPFGMMKGTTHRAGTSRPPGAAQRPRRSPCISRPSRMSRARTRRLRN